MKGPLCPSFQLPQVSSNLLQRRQQSFTTTTTNVPSSSNAAVTFNDGNSLGIDGDSIMDDKDCILSQDFFCTPDYITPLDRGLMNGVDSKKEDLPCPKSPEKKSSVKFKRPRQENPLSPSMSEDQQIVELDKDYFVTDEPKSQKTLTNTASKTKNYVSEYAVALRCRIMPPPCVKNPYLKDASETDVDPFGNQRSKCAGFIPAQISGDGLSRYYTEFQEIEKIGSGNFSCVFKVLKRIDGCLYAVKRITRQLHKELERRKALMEVQALAAIGFNENVVGYYTSWFENAQLYIQTELCDQSLSINNGCLLSTEGQVMEALYQIAKALEYIHAGGIAHLDVKPDNIYVKNGVYKLGDFGCATLLDNSLPIEEGDARYMPQEIINENYDHLDKVDIFSLGATIYELLRGSPLPESGSQFRNLRKGKLPLLPGHSVQLQCLLKSMLDTDPALRPSAKEIIENPIFDKSRRIAKPKQNLC
ncbi:hypothetical protein ACFE04_016641 [Oxalis oulophora]